MRPSTTVLTGTTCCVVRMSTTRRGLEVGREGRPPWGPEFKGNLGLCALFVLNKFSVRVNHTRCLSLNISNIKVCMCLVPYFTSYGMTENLLVALFYNMWYDRTFPGALYLLFGALITFFGSLFCIMCWRCSKNYYTWQVSL